MKGLDKDKIVLVNLSGRGDMDMHTVSQYLSVDTNVPVRLEKCFDELKRIKKTLIPILPRATRCLI